MFHICSLDVSRETPVRSVEHSANNVRILCVYCGIIVHNSGKIGQYC
jgi:hypothetical protein